MSGTPRTPLEQLCDVTMNSHLSISTRARLYDIVNGLSEQLSSAEARALAAEKALRELVRLEDLANKPFAYNDPKQFIALGDYKRDAPLAWDAARALLVPGEDIKSTSERDK